MCAGAPASAVRSHLAYHRAIGFERVFLYLDDASDEYWQSLALPNGGDGVVVTRCDAAFWRRLLRMSAMVARRSEQSVFEDAARWWETEVQSRQSLCVEHAVVRASADGLDWLLHIDIDEAFLPCRLHPVDFFGSLPAATEQVFFSNLEAAPETLHVSDWFQEVSLFKLNAALLADASPGGPSAPPSSASLDALWRRIAAARSKAHGGAAPASYFIAYVSGKSAVRLPGRRAEVWPVPYDVHKFLVPDGTGWRAPLTVACAAELDAADGPTILHYCSCGLENWREKYRRLGRFGDRWWGRVPIRIPAHLQSRDVLLAEDGRAEEGRAEEDGRAETYYRAAVMGNTVGEHALLRARGLLPRVEFVRSVLSRLVDPPRERRGPPPAQPSASGSAAVPSAESISLAHESLLALFNSGPGVALGSSDLFDGALGLLPQSRAATLHHAAARLLARVRLLLSSFELPPLLCALKRLVAPRDRLEELAKVDENRLGQLSTLYLAALTTDGIRARRIDPSRLAALRDRKMAHPRASWAAAFGLRLPRPDRWPAPRGRGEEGNEASRLLDAVRAAGGSLAALSLHDTLVLLQRLVYGAPSNPLMARGWASPFAWFVRSTVHFALAPTREAVDALATYLQRRQRQIQRGRDGPLRPVVEVGAGSGHLARLLNATGRLSPPLVATEPFPEGYAQSEEALFGPGFGDGLGGVEAMHDGDAIARHRPALVLCAFMTAGEDWTPAWRAAGVDEYVLIGDLGHGKGAYSLNGDHGGYERVLLEEVSAELLEAGQAALEGTPCEGAGYLVAVAFRRRRGVDVV